MRTFSTTVLLLVLTLVPGIAAANLLVVDLRTDFRPGDEFIQASTVVRDNATGAAFGLERTTAFLTDDFVAGQRIAEFDGVPSGVYRVLVTLRDASDSQVAHRQILVDLRVATAVTALITRPSGGAEKTATLVVDNDGDGAVGVGDRVRYSVSLTGPADTFVDDLSPDLALVPGSVITTDGRVSLGNDPADTTVKIVGLGGAVDPVVEFEADVTPRVTNQGFLLLRRFEGRVWVPTDDPSTPEIGDPTSLEVSCPFDRCSEDLGRCETERTACEEDLTDCARDLTTCREEREALEAEVLRLETRLSETLGDPDEDGVPIILDLCPSTPTGAAVDDRGCSLEQFCSTIDVTALGPPACNGADWLSDETGSNPRDCRARAGVCEPAG